MARLPEVLTVSVRIKTNISLWDALKLRLAGASAVREYIKGQLEAQDG